MVLNIRIFPCRRKRRTKRKSGGGKKDDRGRWAVGEEVRTLAGISHPNVVRFFGAVKV